MIRLQLFILLNENFLIGANMNLKKGLQYFQKNYLLHFSSTSKVFKTIQVFVGFQYRKKRVVKRFLFGTKTGFPGLIEVHGTKRLELNPTLRFEITEILRGLVRFPNNLVTDQF